MADDVVSQMLIIDELKDQWDSTINNAVSQGITWSQAAGNDGQKKWVGEFNDPDGNYYLNFTSDENCNEIDVSGAEYGQDVYVLMAWDLDNAGSTYDDYDLYITNEFGVTVDSSTINQILFPVGLEACKFTPVPEEKYFLFVEQYLVAVPQEIALLLGVDKFPNFTHYTAEGTVKLYPPAHNSNVITVGAVPYYDPYNIEPYSSQGPAYDNLIKPDLVAPDYVSTASWPSFQGTSAAAPHVAGVCALVKQANPYWLPAQIKNFLESNALDLGTPGKDNVYGAGLVQLPAIISETPTANAGPDQTVDESDTVTLDGSNSSDPDDGIASYLWTQTAGASVTLSDPEAIQPTFTAPNVGPDGASLSFELTVTDNGGLQSADTCIVKVVFDPDKDNDGLPDDWELTYFGDLSKDGTADSDSDGLSDKDEYEAGTDPTVKEGIGFADFATYAIYVGYYGRPADPSGLTYWADRFDASDNLDEVIAAFGESTEFTDNFGSLTDSELVNNLYQQMFGRDAEAEGLTFYTDLLESGEATLASIAKQIVDGASGDDVTVLANKVTVAQTYTEAVTSMGSTYEADDIADARAILDAVDATDASVTAGDAAAEAEVASNVEGGTFTLTENPDTATANIFEAHRVWNPDDSDQMNSLNDDDVLTGVGDNPTLNFTFITDTETGDFNIMPEMTGIETINTKFTAGVAQTLDLQDTTGLLHLNATRIDNVVMNITFDNIQAAFPP